MASFLVSMWRGQRAGVSPHCAAGQFDSILEAGIAGGLKFVSVCQSTENVLWVA